MNNDRKIMLVTRIHGYAKDHPRLVAGVCGAYTVLYFVGFRRAVYLVSLVVLGWAIAVAVYSYYVLVYQFPKPNPRVKSTHFEFLNHWDAEQASLLARGVLDHPIVEESFLISETLDDFIDLIIQEFVSRWFVSITADTTFQESIKSELQSVFIQLKSRIESVNVSKLLVSKLVPIINDHLIDYTKAEERVRQKINSNMLQSDNDIDVARQYRRGKIHEAVTISKTGNSTNEKTYLRSKVGSILPYLLSEKESNNELSMSLVREILACSVLANIFQLLGEGDFYNLLIVKLIGDNLKRSDQVKKLRAALEEHTQQKRQDDYKISANMDIVSYNNCLERIAKLKSLEELKQLRVYISLQLLQNQQNDEVYTSRLKEVQSLVEKRIEKLQTSVTLDKIATNKTYSEEFGNFLKPRNKLKYFQLWLAIEKLKAPLEDNKLTLSIGFTNPKDMAQIYNHIRSLNLMYDTDLFDKYNSATDLSQKSEIFHRLREQLFVLQREVYYKIEEDYKEFSATLASTNKISSVVIKAVEDAFTQIMRNDEDLEAYDTTKFFGDLSDNESGTDTDSISSDTLHNSMDSLNEDEQDSIVLAAPGDLKLSEAIDKLTDDIQRLNDQLEILAPLIKKAELTNNISELKILKNSKLSLEREITSKELQKQQYIVQENDNSLYGRSKVSIQSYIRGSEHGQEFILYIIEVQRFSNDTNTAGWIIARRFSQFFKLHEYLRSIYPEVSNLKFPKRTVFKLQQQPVVELRKNALEEYLQCLLEIPEVCGNRVFRSFLSSENFDLGKNQTFGEIPNKRKQMDAVTNTLYTRFTNKKKLNNEEVMANLQEMERELKSFDEKGVFIKPLVDILMTVFKLKNSKSWIRGRGLLVILQQIFGTTIERKINEQLDKLQQEEFILDVCIKIKNIVFPNGHFKDPPVIRSSVERLTTQEESRFLLSLFMGDTFSTIFGVGNTKHAFNMLFNSLQNDFLVKHLLFEIFDEILAELFPEVTAGL